jgi:hypothetical protein
LNSSGLHGFRWNNQKMRPGSTRNGIPGRNFEMGLCDHPWE